MAKTEPKFTKGPWFCTCIGHIKECMGDPPKTIAVIPGVASEAKMSGITEAKANAALIAAAPELYAALQEAVSEMCSNYACEPCPHTREDYTECTKEDGTCFVQRWIKLLARARGEAEK